MILSLVWLIPAAPLFGAVVNGFFGNRYSRATAHRIGIGTIAFSFLISLFVFSHVIGVPAPKNIELYSWIFGESFSVPIGFLIDPLTTVMLLIVTGVGLLIHIYSAGYMHDDPGYSRFFSYLNLFVFSMLLLVMGNNFLVLFIGWEGVGLCSYLLIAFWFEKTSASQAGTKAFVVNRIGDAGFLIAIFFVFSHFGTLTYTEIFPRAGELSTAMATAIALCLLVGAVGKSAQLPLYTWLPDAMEGPTPVSALIHAATMVTAGVYMVVRTHAIFDLAPFAMNVVAIIGGLTAFFAATIGLVQNDIKRVLAYSTVSQLGFMFLACGVGAYIAAIFHLMTHAFFKALLFMGAGSVIHSLSGEQDIRKMGGLWSKIPTTAWTFFVGAIAIAGIPPLAGFWSKDEILAGVFKEGHYILWGLGTLTAFLTAFYMFRLFYLTFHGESRVEHEAIHHLHESPKIMTYPLVVLAFLSIAGGMVLGFPPETGWIHHFLGSVAGGKEHHALSMLDFVLIAISVFVAVGGWLVARNMYKEPTPIPSKLSERYQGAYSILLNKYWVDEFYDRFIVQTSKIWGVFLWMFDRNFVDGLVRGVGRMAQGGAAFSTWIEKYIIYGFLNIVAYFNHVAAAFLKLMQTGLVHHYAAIIVFGLFVLLNVFLLVAFRMMAS
ncbi:MAG TPA: NADH-quinone oxidoreductase subunit L [Nitrospiria bacterium]